MIGANLSNLTDQSDAVKGATADFIGAGWSHVVPDVTAKPGGVRFRALVRRGIHFPCRF